MTEPLDPLSLPLAGSRLIEASAGTGKTWTIAALYLRLVLGHGTDGQGAPRRPLGPSAILVMTFTRAATRELSDRIRERLIEAARCFRGEPGPHERDPFLQALMVEYPAGDARSQAAYRLALAAEAMDEAAVHTIDAWCQRMLREHAFDSGNLFNEELVADEAELLEQAMHDVWRSEVYPLDGETLEVLLSVWPSVAHMQQQVQPLLMHAELIEPTPHPHHLLADWLPGWVAQRLEALAGLKDGWATRAEALRAWLGAQMAQKKPPFDGRKVQARFYNPWLDALADWAEDPVQARPELTESAWSRLSPAGMREALKAGLPLPVLPGELDTLVQLREDLAALPPLRGALMQHAARRVALRLDQLKRRSARFGFADLQQRLDRALAGPQGERLRQGILAQYPVALVDEFQDTSPLQYRLFDRLYRVADNDPATALLLIGDPKQSIYGFRGADIYSYLDVRRATEGRHHVLGTNFRSTQPLVAAVNAVFLQAEARLPGGAFHFDRHGPMALPFEPVAARGRAERFSAGEAAVPALTARVLDEPLPQRTLTTTLAEHAAEQMVAWLNDPSCGFRREDGGLHRLAPGDVAVLVRSRREADAVRRALQRRGVSSVYLSDQDSVFSSAEAQDLLRWLMAVADPLDAPLARAAYATVTVGLSLEELARQVNDELAWDRRVSQLQRLRGVWQRQGVLTLVRQTLHELDLPARWLSTSSPVADGERRLTNLLHLGELLQAASVQLDGEQAQIRWLAEQIHGFGGQGEERVVRLESDAELVQVVTVHKSKGLEYPVVFLPFAAGFREVSRRGQRFVAWVDDNGRRALDFTLHDEAMAAAERERLREDLRLFYVALTRARHALWLGVGALKAGKAGENSLHKSALGYLLAGGAPLPPAEVLRIMGVWAQARAGAEADSLSIESVGPRSGYTRLQPRSAGGTLAEAPHYRASFDRRWAVGSFSALVRDLRDLREAPAWGAVAAGPGLDSVASPWTTDPLREEQLREEWQAQQPEAGADELLPARPPVAALGMDAAPWHRFPRGALAGNFLHELLQWLAEEGFSRWPDEGVQRAVTRRCERQGHGERVEDVLTWMDAVLHTPLPPLRSASPPAGPTRLVDLRTVLPEMEFWMPSAALQCRALDELCQTWLLPGRPRPALVPRTLHGLLMGFADLVFEHEGRYWVLDYKSNHLGATDADYHAEALEQAVLAHRYELQAALYLLALHRLLGRRLGPAYDPAEHLGGAVCFFLRGVRGPVAGCVQIGAEPAMLAALDACLA